MPFELNKDEEKNLTQILCECHNELEKEMRLCMFSLQDFNSKERTAAQHCFAGNNAAVEHLFRFFGSIQGTHCIDRQGCLSLFRKEKAIGLT